MTGLTEKDYEWHAARFGSRFYHPCTHIGFIGLHSSVRNPLSCYTVIELQEIA